MSAYTLSSTFRIASFRAAKALTIGLKLTNSSPAEILNANARPKG
jgi:hypothetical protein